MRPIATPLGITASTWKQEDVGTLFLRSVGNMIPFYTRHCSRPKSLTEDALPCAQLHRARNREVLEQT